VTEREFWEIERVWSTLSEPHVKALIAEVKRLREAIESLAGEVADNGCDSQEIARDLRDLLGSGRFAVCQ
jgi:hypothetical protein